MYFLKGTSTLAAYIQEIGHKNLLKFQDASGKKNEYAKLTFYKIKKQIIPCN